jgi:putative tryptophan/tyrosine transport system substrate-binding protein
MRAASSSPPKPKSSLRPRTSIQTKRTAKANSSHKTYDHNKLAQACSKPLFEQKTPAQRRGFTFDSPHFAAISCLYLRATFARTAWSWGGYMRRREFIIGGAAAAWPLGAWAQDRVRRVGVLMHTAADEPEAQARFAAFLQGLQEAGWAVGSNVRIDTRWSVGDNARLRRDALELVALGPDVILAGVGGTVGALQQANRTVPIVFAQAVDPVGNSFVESLARPGGNTTGFIQFEYVLSGKWLELLKEIAPRVTRVGVLREPGPAGVGQWAIIQSVAQTLGVELKPIGVANAGEIERAISALAAAPNGGLIVAVSGASLIHRELIVGLAARHQLPTSYAYRHFVASGGLISYGANIASQYRLAAGYVDRILKGEKPADLPVQAPTKYDLTINLKTARVLGLTVPPSVLARADEVIE